MFVWFLYFFFICADAAQEYVVTEEVWFDVEVKDFNGEKMESGEDYRGRFVIAVFGDVTPMATTNFVTLAKGYKRKGETLTYKNTPIHRIVPDFVIQMGDVTEKNGFGGTSIYGETFPDEGFMISHRAPGIVSMANKGADSNNSQFFILLTKSRWLDKKHVAFGKVIRGMDVVRAIGEITPNFHTAVPTTNVTIVDCGINGLKTKYTLTEEQIDSEEDL